MGRGSNHNALEAKQLLYGSRPSGRGPQRLQLQETPASFFSLFGRHNKTPSFLKAEFPNCQATVGRFLPPENGDQISDSKVNFIGINDDGSEKSLGILISPERSFYYFDDTCPIGKTVAASLLPGNRDEQRLLRVLADNSAPGQEVEFTVYRPEQLESLLDNYADKDLCFADPNNLKVKNEISVLDKIYSNHTLLEAEGAAQLAQAKTMQELLEKDGGKEILMTYFQGGNVLNICANLDKFRTS